ncbi:MAG: hypothetical protein FJ197_08920 [Gammaproteobacteria bacterium]|nr:hypothetical protein [Gammaproteobacteria bacterium]
MAWQPPAPARSWQSSACCRHNAGPRRWWPRSPLWPPSRRSPRCWRWAESCRSFGPARSTRHCCCCCRESRAMPVPQNCFPWHSCRHWLAACASCSRRAVSAWPRRNH